MDSSMTQSLPIFVALLAEGVDRNFAASMIAASQVVALLAEGVDRNPFISTGIFRFPGRPPRGGRG